MYLELGLREMEERPRSDPLAPIVSMLAFFAAMRNYGYVDAIGNALERTTALEALGNALRDFLVTCVQASPEARAKLESDEKVRCPNVSAKELQEAVESFNRLTLALEERGELVRFLREIYVRALALAPSFKVEGEGEKK